MNKVITINLNGRAYQLEEAGYEALRKYLDGARAALHEDPDKDEIMADLETAVADKCDACLKGVKNVVTAAEVDAIIAKMGPVEGKGGAEKNAAAGVGAGGADGIGTDKKTAGPKRLYRIVEGSRIRGVCTGLAAYFNMDVGLVRVIFVLLTIFTGGGWVVAYVALVLILPVARTADEVAQAHGEVPFTAQDLIDRARAEYAKFAAEHANHASDGNGGSGGVGDKDEWKQKMRAWKHEMRLKRRAWKDEWHLEREKRRAEAETEHDYGHGHWIGAAIGGIITFVLLILFIVAVVSFLRFGVVFGHVFGMGHPVWVSLVFLFAAFWLISLPFRHMADHARCCGYGHHGHYHHHGGGLITLIFLALLIYMGVALFPQMHEAWNTVVAYLQSVPR
jgi:phage shock protein PspC (stress-responsive transcriptional regulator)